MPKPKPTASERPQRRQSQTLRNPSKDGSDAVPSSDAATRRASYTMPRAKRSEPDSSRKTVRYEPGAHGAPELDTRLRRLLDESMALRGSVAAMVVSQRTRRMLGHRATVALPLDAIVSHMLATYDAQLALAKTIDEGDDMLPEVAVVHERFVLVAQGLELSEPAFIVVALEAPNANIGMALYTLRKLALATTY
ncbi:MAG: hypothetical protein R3B72_39490 [Polyangiaceae bacterium]